MTIPNSVRYIKNGQGGKWWPTAKEKSQLHAGWNNVPGNLLSAPNYEVIRPLCPTTQDCKALMTLLDNPSQHVWITFESGHLWWCLVENGVTTYGPSTQTSGHFSLQCSAEHPWSNIPIAGSGKLIITDLPGTATSTAGFKGTVCTPKASDQILRIIRGERNPLSMAAKASRLAYEHSIHAVLKQLSPQDFELLISLILDRTGWTRLSRIGGVTEGIDIDVENPASRERAFVQVKGSASQAELDDYISRFQDREHYARMIFAVHSPKGELHTQVANVQVWDGPRLSELAVRLGLGEWIESKLA